MLPAREESGECHVASLWIHCNKEHTSPCSAPLPINPCPPLPSLLSSTCSPPQSMVVHSWGWERERDWRAVAMADGWQAVIVPDGSLHLGGIPSADWLRSFPWAPTRGRRASDPSIGSTNDATNGSTREVLPKSTFLFVSTCHIAWYLRALKYWWGEGGS
jgi:hypothetical protein